jgi:hypothetical protein
MGPNNTHINLGGYNCEIASCVAYRDWVIEKLTTDTLEIKGII